MVFGPKFARLGRSRRFFAGLSRSRAVGRVQHMIVAEGALLLARRAQRTVELHDVGVGIGENETGLSQEMPLIILATTPFPFD